MKIHRLKTLSHIYDDMIAEVKTFDYRKNDRNFKVGDILIFRKWLMPLDVFDDHEFQVQVIYILTDCPGLPKGYCVMQFKPLPVAY